MRKNLFMALLFSVLIPATVNAQESCKVCGNHTEAEKAEIAKAIEYYIEGGRQGSSTVARKGFAETATMSWCEDGKLKSVPIQALYDLYDQPEKPESGVTYEMTLCHVAGDVAVVSIESQFGKNRFTDMFTLVKDTDGWKIVSKVYHSK